MSNGNQTSSSLSWGRLLKKLNFNSSLPRNFEVHLVDGRIVTVDLDELVKSIKHRDLLVKDIVKDVCRQVEIMPKNCAFFGLLCENSNGTSVWIVQTRSMNDFNVEKKQKYMLKLQFKVLAWQELRKRDKNAYDYYLKQCRFEFRTGIYSKYLGSRQPNKESEKILLRMVILEMMMIVREQNISPLKDILKNKYRRVFNIEEILRKYSDSDAPRDIQKCKQKVEKSLSCFSKVQEPDRDFITEVELLPGFKEEVFHLQKFECGRSKPNNIELWITPKDVTKRAVISKVKHCLWQSPYNMFHHFKVCEKDKDRGIKTMILRGDEPPEIMYCTSEDQCESICSHLDGFYRLLVNQYNSILHDTCEYLQASPYHGSMDREIVPKILTMKGREGGNYLIREHSKYHGSYILSLITDDDKFIHIQIMLEQQDGQKQYVIDKIRTFDSLESLQDHYKTETNAPELKTCLRKIILPKHSGDVPLYSDPSTFRPILPGRKALSTFNENLGPTLLDSTQLDFIETIKQGTFGDILKYKKDGKELIVKRFPTLSEEMLSNISYTLCKLKNHEFVVQFLGLSLSSGMFLAFEYLPFGSLDIYMKHHRNDVTYSQLLKFLYQMTDALSAIHAEGYVHADIRFENLFVKDENTIKLGNCCITWRLAGFKMLDERIFRKRYTHLAPEIFLRENAEFSQESDIWSYGLTVWQLFTLQQPFRNDTSHQLMNFFQLLDAKCNEKSAQPPLVLLNMNILRHCNDLLLELFNLCLHMKSEKRAKITDVFKKVQEITDKAPSKDKQKCYFSYDWEARNREIEENKKKYKSPSQEPTEFHSGDSGYHTLGSSGSQASLSRDLNLNTSFHSDDTTFPFNNSDVQTTDKHVSDILQVASVPEEKEASESSAETSLETGKNDLLKDENGVSEERLLLHTTTDEKMDLEPTRKLSQSAPSSPTRPQIFRSISANESQKRDEQEFETASILVNLSQTKVPNSSTEPVKPLPFNTDNPGSLVYVPAYSLLGNSLRMRPPNPYVQDGKPFPLTPQSVSQEYIKSIQLRQNTSSSSVQQQQTGQHRKGSPPLSPRPPPPDSPEASKREFASDQPRREILRDDKTRIFLQERINRERDRSRGKRSLSFTEEYDEYKNNTKRAAKRALMGPNPFNIGIKLPEDFLLRSDSRMLPAAPALPCDVTRFFRTDNDKRFNGKSEYPEGPASSPLDPYRNMMDIEMYRKNILKNSETKPHQKESHKTPEEMQAVLKGIQDMHASSPKSANNFDETSDPVSSTISVFAKTHGISSIHMEDKKVHYPYPRSVLPSNAPIYPVYSVSATTSPRKGEKGKELTPSSHSIPSSIFNNRPPIFQPEPIRVVRAPGPGIGLFDNGYQRHAFIHPSQPFMSATDGRLPLAPPALQRHGPPPMFVGLRGEPLIQIPFTPLNPRLPLVPISSMVRVTGSSTTSPPQVKVKTEPEDDIDVRCKQRKPVGEVLSAPNNFEKSYSTANCLPQPFQNPKEPSNRLFRYISHKSLRTDRKLGEGQFGEVYEGIWDYTDKNKVPHRIPVAVKRLKRSDQPLSQEALLEFKQEAEAMSQLNGDKQNEGAKHIIKLYGVCTDDQYEFSIITEKAIASLDDYIYSRKKVLSRGDALLYCRQIACGMEYLHSKNFLHRDLSCRNILVIDKALIKISDFGLSRLLHDKGYYKISNKKVLLPIRWLSIEAIGHSKFSKMSDYWSYGVTVWEIFTIFNPHYDKPRAKPYEHVENKDLHAYLLEPNRLKRPDECPEQLWELVEKCFASEPNSRPSFFVFHKRIKEIMDDIKYTM